MLRRLLSMDISRALALPASSSEMRLEIFAEDFIESEPFMQKL